MIALKTSRPLQRWDIVCVVLLTIFSLRVFLENTWFPIELTRVVFLHEVSFFFMAFGLLLAVYGILTNEPLPITVEKVTVIMFLVLLGPILDKFIFGRTMPYGYTSPDQLKENTLTFFLAAVEVGPGLVIELGLILLLAVTLVYLSTKSAIKSLFALIVIYFGLQWIACPALYLPLPGNPIMRNLPLYQYAERLLYYIHNVGLFLGAIALFMAFRNYPLLRILIANIRWSRAGVFVVLCLLGFKSAGFWNAEYATVVTILAASLAVFLLWESAVMLNDAADWKIDRMNGKKRPVALGLISPLNYRKISYVVAGLSVGTAFLLGWLAFLCAIGYVALSFLYSSRPFYLKANPLAFVVIGLAAVLSYLLGFFAGQGVLSWSEALYCGFIFTVIGLGAMAKDIPDAKGDSAAGVVNLVTALGLNRARYVISILLLFAFLSPLLIVRETHAVIFFLVLGTLVGFQFWKTGNYLNVVRAAVVSLLFVLMAGCANTTTNPRLEEYETAVRESQGYFENHGFVSPDLRLVVRVKPGAGLFYNYSYAKGKTYNIVFDSQQVEQERFVACHEVFHYFQVRYLGIPKSIDERWLREGTATAMAQQCSGIVIPLPRPLYAGNPFSKGISSRFWVFLTQRDREIILALFQSLIGQPIRREIVERWLSVRLKMPFEDLAGEFGEWYKNI